MASSPKSPQDERPALRWIHLGRQRYRPVLERQLEQWEAVRDERATDTIFTVEHEPVITLGKRATDGDVLLSEDDLRTRGIDLVRTDRGGEATWHGPGQLVLYPIIHVTRAGLGASDLVRGLADEIRKWLATIGIACAWDNEHPGLWVAPKPDAPLMERSPAKITAVGMKIQSGVSRHGAALNVSNDLSPWALFVPCGMPHARATSVQKEAPEQPTALEPIARVIVHGFAERFGYQVVEDDNDEGR